MGNSQMTLRIQRWAWLIAVTYLCSCASTEEQQGYEQDAENHQQQSADAPSNQQANQQNFGQEEDYENFTEQEAENQNGYENYEESGQETAQYQSNYENTPPGNQENNYYEDQEAQASQQAEGEEVNYEQNVEQEIAQYEGEENPLAVESKQVEQGNLFENAPTNIDSEQPEVANFPTEEPVPEATTTEYPAQLSSPLVPPTDEPEVGEEDVIAALATLWWVGYEYLPTEKVVRLELITRGLSQYDIVQEYNRLKQPELVVRFYQTRLRKKIRRDIDASEFRSPVAYVRMREDPVEMTVEVVLTLRDEVKPRLVAKGSNLLLTFDIPDRYQSKKDPTEDPVAEAEVLPGADVMPTLEAGSRLPKAQKVAQAYVPDPGGQVFDGVEASDGTPVEPETVSNEDGGAFDIPENLPEDFGNFSEDAEDPFASESNNPALTEPNDAYEADEEPVDYEENPEPTSEQYEEQGFDENAAHIEVKTFWAAAVGQDDLIGYEDNMFGNSGNNVIEENVSLETENSVGTEPVAESEIIGQDSETATGSYEGRPLQLEFYQARLDHVLKVFAEESGLNFIFGASVASQTISVNFKGVPWDEALKAILDTQQLAMVRIGENVVRIDNIERVNDYLQREEQAREIQNRATPPKVLVVRLSFARAQAVLGQVQSFVLSQSLNLDGTQLPPPVADERTNSLIIEARPNVLSKVKALIERLDVPVPQAEFVSRIVEVSRNTQDFLGLRWGGALNFDPGRGLGFGTIVFPNYVASRYAKRLDLP